jgi:hypothetical protein
MIDEREIRESLLRRARLVRFAPVDTPTAVRRARRRVLLNGVATAVAAIAVIAATVAGVGAIRRAPIPADDRSQRLGIFAPVAGRIVFVNEGFDSGYGPGAWAVNPSGPHDTSRGPAVDVDVASSLVPLNLGDAVPLDWSRDGSELLIVRWDGGQDLIAMGYLSILHADGSETRLNREPMQFGGATISPDGSRVLFGGQGDLVGLYVVDDGGDRPVPLPIPQAEEGAGSPAFSPDGTQIAYLAGDDRPELWVANADGTDAHRILADEGTPLLGLTGLEWSPTGDRLAIGVGDREGGGRPAIYTFAPDGSDFTKVITGGISPHWSPDGTRIAYTIPCDANPDGWCPEGSIRRAEFDPRPNGRPAGLAIADADGSNVRAFGFAASGPWHPGTGGAPGGDVAAPVPEP